MANQTIPEDILKIQKKLATFERDSRNYKKYTKILAKHIKQHVMKKRVASHIKTIENVHQMQESSSKNESNEK